MSQKLGQHFLINKSAIDKIIAVLNLRKNDTIIEIGPGTGALTIPLSEKCRELGCKIIAIEKDPGLVESIKYKVLSMGGEIIQGDALRVLPKIHTEYLIPNTKYKLVGNIPYYITGKLLRILGELENKPELIVLTIQKEVAERVTAKPPKMNLLAAAVQIWAEPEIIMNLKSKDFDPPPKVDSAIIKLESRIQNLESKALERYYRLIRIIFKQPRKTLLNNLCTPFDRLRVKGRNSKEETLKILKEIGLTGQERPQNLSLSQLLQLSRELE